MVPEEFQKIRPGFRDSKSINILLKTAFLSQENAENLGYGSSGTVWAGYRTGDNMDFGSYKFYGEQSWRDACSKPECSTGEGNPKLTQTGSECQ